MVYLFSFLIFFFREIDLHIPVFHKHFVKFHEIFVKYSNKSISRIFCLFFRKLCIIVLVLVSTTNSEPIHQDSRCNCVCPDPSLVGLPNTDEYENIKIQKAIEDRRTIYINSTVSPNECNCHSVVLIHLNLNESQAGKCILGQKI